MKYEKLIDRLKQFVLIGQAVRQYIREHGYQKNTVIEVEKAFDLLGARFRWISIRWDDYGFPRRAGEVYSYRQSLDRF